MSHASSWDTEGLKSPAPPQVGTACAEQMCLRPALCELVGLRLHPELLRRAGKRQREKDQQDKL